MWCTWSNYRLLKLQVPRFVFLHLYHLFTSVFYAPNMMILIVTYLGLMRVAHILKVQSTFVKAKSSPILQHELEKAESHITTWSTTSTLSGIKEWPYQPTQNLLDFKSHLELFVTDYNASLRPKDNDNWDANINASLVQISLNIFWFM